MFNQYLLDVLVDDVKETAALSKCVVNSSTIINIKHNSDTE